MREFQVEYDDDAGEWMVVGLGERERDVLDVVVVQEEAGTPFVVDVALANMLRDVPAEAVMRAGVAAALSAVPGVVSVVEEDRETWWVEGPASGPALALATVEFLYSRFDEFQEALDAEFG